MKKIVGYLLIIIMLGIYGVPCVSAAGLQLYYDGEYHTYTGNIYTLYVNDRKINPPLDPIIFNDRALVPLREVFEALGQAVEYEDDTKKITVSGNGKKVELQIGNNIAYINSAKKEIPDGVVPKLITKVGGETKTMVPVRFISESVGLDVEFDADVGAIKINKNEEQQLVINSTEINKNNNFITVIKLRLSKPMGNTLKTAVTDGGVLYFDISNAVYTGNSRTEVNHGAVKMLRLGLHEDYTRVAVDMVNYSEYDVKLSNDKKLLTITVVADDEDNVSENEQEDSENESDDAITDTPNDTDDGNDDEAEEDISIPETVTVTTDVESLMNYIPSNGKKYVVIDAGHGGKDSGAKGDFEESTFYEKDINLNIAKLVQQKLEENGVDVIMTRTGDTYPTLNERSALANKHDAGMFVSIHVNSASNAPKANGIEVYYAKGNNENYYGITSKVFATSVLDSMLEKTGAFSRGVKVESHLVTRTSLMPAILVEVGFISNNAEIQKLISSEYQEKLADGIVEGILAQIDNVSVPDRRTLAEKMVAEEIGMEKAKEYVDGIWK